MVSESLNWRLREIKNIRGLFGNEFYLKVFRPRTFWRIFVANIREVYSSFIRTNIRGCIFGRIFGGIFAPNIRPAKGPDAGAGMHVDFSCYMHQHAVHIGSRNIIG